MSWQIEPIASTVEKEHTAVSPRFYLFAVINIATSLKAVLENKS